jgi:transglutaminase/protease-like cytokinesis protein 3
MPYEVTESDHHWYLMKSIWGTGHFNEQKAFECQRPNRMIYHHLPEDGNWQLLRTPIKMSQYMQMPKLRPLYFEPNLELISPCNQAHVLLVHKKIMRLNSYTNSSGRKSYS